MDYSDPLGILNAYHDEILRQVGLLEECARWIDNGHDATEVRHRADTLRRFFSVADRIHHQDEEQDLFPRLKRVSQTMADLLQQLRTEHQQIEALWARLDPLLANPAELAQSDAFREMVLEFSRMQHQHVSVEQGELLETARQFISQKEQLEIGRAFARRRGQTA